MSQVVIAYIQSFLALQLESRSREELITELFARPPHWLQEVCDAHEPTLEQVKQAEHDCRLFDLVQGLYAIARGLLALAQSNTSEQHCSMIQVTSSVRYPYHPEVPLPTQLARVTGWDHSFAPRHPNDVWHQSGLRTITLHAGTSYLTKLPVAYLGLVFQKGSDIVVVNLDLHGHIAAWQFTPVHFQNHLVDFVLGVTSAGSTFSAKRELYRSADDTSDADEQTPAPHDPAWLADHLPHLSELLHELAGRQLL